MAFIVVSPDGDASSWALPAVGEVMKSTMAQADGPIAPSCEDAAVKNAMARAGTIEEGFAPRGTTWVTSSRWQAPYPAEWCNRYPD
jgi:hypothetical protein